MKPVKHLARFLSTPVIPRETQSNSKPDQSLGFLMGIAISLGAGTSAGFSAGIQKEHRDLEPTTRVPRILYSTYQGFMTGASYALPVAFAAKFPTAVVLGAGAIIVGLHVRIKNDDEIEKASRINKSKI